MAKDVCECLELGNPRTSVALLDDDEKGVTTNYTPGGMALEMLRDAGVAVEVIDN